MQNFAMWSSRESIFSDMNNLAVVTAAKERYADCFGFTGEEVFQALEQYGLSGEKKNVKEWYDGFVFEGKEILIG